MSYTTEKQDMIITPLNTLQKSTRVINSNRFTEICKKVKSCKELKPYCPECKSGLYEMDFDQPTKVYCDLETDGGKKFYI